MNSVDEIELYLQELGLEIVERYDCEDEYDPYTAFGISEIILYCVGELYRLSIWTEYDENVGRFEDLYWPKDFSVKCDGLANRILLKSSQLPESTNIICGNDLKIVLNKFSKEHV